jgi:hypothetical protein
MTKISQLSSAGSSLNVVDAFVIQTPGDLSTPNKKLTVSGLTTYLNTALNISSSGTVSFVGASGVGPITVSGSPITTSGQFVVRFNLSGITDIGALATNDEIPIRDLSDGSVPNKKVTISGLTSYLNTALNINASGIVVVPSGTAASPSISASGDSDTGIFFPSGNTLGITTGGVERIRTGSGETKLSTDLKLDDGGTFTTTVQCVTPTANRTISFPDLTGTVALVAGSNGQVPYNASGVLAGSSTTFSPTDGTRFIVPFGYGTGAGGAVTQATNKSTAVTLNANCGQITMHNATLSGDTTVSFGLSNSTVASGDVLVLNHVAGGTFGSYLLNARTVASSGTIDVRNITGSGLGEAIVIGFAVIKATIS